MFRENVTHEYKRGNISYDKKRELLSEREDIKECLTEDFL